MLEYVNHTLSFAEKRMNLGEGKRYPLRGWGSFSSSPQFPSISPLGRLTGSLSFKNNSTKSPSLISIFFALKITRKSTNEFLSFLLRLCRYNTSKPFSDFRCRTKNLHYARLVQLLRVGFFLRKYRVKVFHRSVYCTYCIRCAPLQRDLTSLRIH